MNVAVSSGVCPRTAGNANAADHGPVFRLCNPVNSQRELASTPAFLAATVARDTALHGFRFRLRHHPSPHFQRLFAGNIRGQRSFA